MVKLLNDSDVIVLRFEGTKGGSGMREMLAPTAALIGKGFGETVGLITDGRFSGGTIGLVHEGYIVIFGSLSMRSSC